MCRNIKTLFNFEPPATEMEIRDASLQFVRKLSGFNVPSKANEAAFERAVEEVAAAARVLIRSLVTTADPRDREASNGGTHDPRPIKDGRIQRDGIGKVGAFADQLAQEALPRRNIESAHRPKHQAKRYDVPGLNRAGQGQ